MISASCKIQILKKVDSLLAPLLNPLVAKLFPPAHPISEKINRILVIRPGGIGDAVLLIPSILRLKKRLPHVQIDILAEQRNANIFSLCSAIRSVYQYDNRTFTTVLFKNYDIVIDTEQWHGLSAVIARITRASVSIGFATNERAFLFTHPVPYSQNDHETESFFHLIERLFKKDSFDSHPPFLQLPEPSRQRSEIVLRPFKNKKIVAIFPGGSIKERRWGSDRYHTVAEALNKRGFAIVAIGGGDDASAGREIIAGLRTAIDLTGRLTLPETAAVLQKSALLVTGDSGIMHVAYGLGTPTLSLFGPGIEKKWAPTGANHIVINKHLPCSPCTKFGYTPRCSKNAECMKLITPEEVLERAIKLLEGKNHASD